MTLCAPALSAVIILANVERYSSQTQDNSTYHLSLITGFTTTIGCIATTSATIVNSVPEPTISSYNIVSNLLHATQFGATLGVYRRLVRLMAVLITTGL